jgi:hypothetical protein
MERGSKLNCFFIKGLQILTDKPSFMKMVGNQYLKQVKGGLLDSENLVAEADEEVDEEEVASDVPEEDRAAVLAGVRLRQFLRGSKPNVTQVMKAAMKYASGLATKQSMKEKEAYYKQSKEN